MLQMQQKIYQRLQGAWHAVQEYLRACGKRAKLGLHHADAHSAFAQNYWVEMNSALPMTPSQAANNN